MNILLVRIRSSLFTIVQNITTIYKLNYIERKLIYKHQIYKKTCTHICTDTKVNKNAQLINALVQLQLFIVLGLLK